jgi:transcriptional regulator with XRE-family HTH domain
VDELWTELSASMRALRLNSGMSLREVERTSGRGRGVLSQIENGKARPSRQLVDWYDRTLGGDGSLLSLYVEARSGALPRPPEAAPPHQPMLDDAVHLTKAAQPVGRSLRRIRRSKPDGP